MKNKTKWCEALFFINRRTGETRRILVCSDGAIRYLVLDSVELAYKKHGFEKIKAEPIGWVDDIATVEKEE